MNCDGAFGIISHPIHDFKRIGPVDLPLAGSGEGAARRASGLLDSRNYKTDRERRAEAHGKKGKRARMGEQAVEERHRHLTDPPPARR